MTKCNACGTIESIRTNTDAGICIECGAIEDYKQIENKGKDNE